MVTDKNELLGKTLGTCTLERLIGHGGMGAVYLARQQRPRRSVAVKVFLPGPALDDEARADFLARFRREADAIASLDHINIIPIYEYGEQNQQAYLVMPYISGGTLRQIINTRGPLPLNEALPLVEQIAEALDYAHKLGIIHRDIKPGNILFHADGRLLLADFGLAKILSETTLSAHDDAPSISHGAMIGTPEYISPEQALGKPIDRRTDVYSLGIVLFQMLTGRVPFAGSSPVATAVMHTQSEPPLPSTIMPTITPEVEAVMLQAIAKSPAQRYATAGEFARALHVAIKGDQTTEPPGFQTQRKGASRPPHILLSNDTEPEIEQVTITNNDNTSHTPYEHPSSKTALHLFPLTEPSEKAGRRRLPLLAIISLLLLMLLGASGLIAWINIPLFHNAFLLAPKSTTLSIQRTSTAAPQSVTTPTQQAIPTPLVNAGPLLYQNAALYPTCSGGNPHAWSLDINANLLCKDHGTVIGNTGNNHFLATMFLNSINGYGIPNDYILQVEATPQPGSHSSFGVLFRNQPDQGSLRHNGAYTLLLDPQKQSWTFFFYDDRTGHSTPLSTGIVPVSFNSTLTIDLVIQENNFTFFLNGQELGSAEDSTYPSGTLGFAVNPGASVLFQNLRIYEEPF